MRSKQYYDDSSGTCVGKARFRVIGTIGYTNLCLFSIYHVLLLQCFDCQSFNLTTYILTDLCRDAGACTCKCSWHARHISCNATARWRKTRVPPSFTATRKLPTSSFVHRRQTASTRTPRRRCRQSKNAQVQLSIVRLYGYTCMCIIRRAVSTLACASSEATVAQYLDPLKLHFFVRVVIFLIHSYSDLWTQFKCI